MGATIRDVATEAGVSPATVSRVLNGYGKVSDSAKRRVSAAVRKLRYQTDSTRSESSQGFKPTVVLLVTSLANPFTGELADGVEKTARLLGYHLVIVNTGFDINYQIEVIEDLYEQGVEGFLVGSNGARDRHMLSLVHDGYPLVALTKEAVNLDVHCVVNDDFRGAMLGTQHMIDNGHKQIAAIMMPGFAGLSERVRGYKTVMEQAGLSACIRIQEIQDETIEEGFQATMALLQSCEVTGVLAHNDLVAVGVLQACRQANKRVPDDISVVGYDGTILSTVTDPPLTTLVQPTREIGSAGMKLLHELMTSGVESLHRVVLQPTLNVRGSTARTNG